MDRDVSCHPQADTFLDAETGSGSTTPRHAWKDYLAVTKPNLVAPNLLTTFTGFWLAWSATQPGWPDLHLLLVTLLGTALVIASGCALNNYLDRDLDQRMARTKNRPLPDGRLAPRAAWRLGVTLGIAGITLLALFAGPVASLLALIGLFVYVWVYTAWLKRTSTLNTVIGGISGAMPPIIGWSAVTGTLDHPAMWALFGLMFLWQPPHFLALGMVRADEYRAAGFAMLPVVAGFDATKRQILHYVAAMVPASFLLYGFGVVGKLYFIGAALLGLAYLVMAARGFVVRDDLRWAKQMFAFSLVYLNAILALILVDSLWRMAM